MSYCRYGVQVPAQKTSGKNSPQNENYTEVYTIQHYRKKKPKTEIEQTDVKGDSSGEAELKQTDDNLNKRIKHDRLHLCGGRQCGPVVRALALRSGDPGFKTRSNHSLNLILVVPGSTSQVHL